jgi:hypothetical protein
MHFIIMSLSLKNLMINQYTSLGTLWPASILLKAKMAVTAKWLTATVLYRAMICHQEH